ncbi:MAG: antitoxin [Chloroflexi bacterium]|nr:antitoxin [Chloroflexota bacterium]
MKQRSADLYNDRMTRTVTATEAKATILALLDDVAGGEEVEITKHGRTVARLVPARGPQSLKGKFAGVAMTVANDGELFTTGVVWNLP